MAKVTLGGNPVTVDGNLPKKGDTAPDFTLTGKDLKDVGLKDFAGRRKVLNIVPSLDTPVCAKSTKVFNEKAGSLPDTVVLVISADLPFAAARFCTAEGVNNVVTLSTVHSAKGLEWDNVFLIWMTDGWFPSSRFQDEFDDYEEERRRRAAVTAATCSVTISWMTTCSQ